MEKQIKKVWMIRYKHQDCSADCLPAAFLTKWEAERNIQESCFYPEEWEAIEVEITKYV